MLVATRELRRPILSLRAPPKRLQAALRFLRVRLGRRLRCCGFGFWFSFLRARFFDDSRCLDVIVLGLPKGTRGTA